MRLSQGFSVSLANSSLITYYHNIFDGMFPHPCLQGVHLLAHETKEHSVCTEFQNFLMLHENGRKIKSEAVAGQNSRLQCKSRLEIKQHTSWQVSILVLFGSLSPFLTVPPPSPSLACRHREDVSASQLLCRAAVQM